MAKGLSFNVSGIEGVQKALDRKVEALTKGLDRELTASAFEINEKQITYTPVDTGRLRGANVVEMPEPLHKVLINNVDYAPYIEFGTGGKVSVPAELTDIALQFKGAGIRRVNMRAQPFFFRAFFEEKQNMINRIKKLLE